MSADLLNRCAQCGARLPAGTGVELCPLCVPDEEVMEPAGRLLGDCELFEEIGRGGMGVVWRGRQRGLDRPVAVKTLPGGDLAGAEARARFHTEARATARLKHANIVSIFEVGEADGMPYFVMELIEGRTLSAVVAENPVPARQAARWLRDAALAVVHAHGQGVLHRDLKPSNILIEPGADGGRPRVMDFGLAKLTDSDAAMTRPGGAAGSPAFMPPEQARGGEATVAGDVYGLGAVLYHALTGRPPFQGETLAAVLAQVEKDEPLAPRRLSATVPKDLETISLKCLEKNPARRYPSAQELADDLTRFLEGQPVTARPLGRLPKLLRLARRNPWQAAAAVLITALILTAFAFMAWKSGADREHQAALRTEQSATKLALMRSQLGEARAIIRLRLADSRPRALAAAEALSGHDVPVAVRAEARDVALAALALTAARAEPLLGAGVVSDDWTMAAADPRRNRWALATYRGPVRIRPLTSGEDSLTFSTAPRAVTAVIGFSPDGRWLAIRHADELGIWDTAPEAAERLVFSAKLWAASPFGFMKTAFAPDGSAVVWADHDSVVVTELPGGQELERWRGAEDAPLEAGAVAFDPGGALVAVALAGEPAVEVRRRTGGGVVQKLAGFPRPVTALALTAHAERIAAGDAEGYVCLRRSGDPADRGRDLNSHTEALRGLAFDEAGRVLFSSSEDGTLRAWDCVAGGESVRLAFDTGLPAVSADGLLSGVGLAAGRLSMVRLEPSEILRRFRPDERAGARQWISFPPDGLSVYCLTGAGGSRRALPGGGEKGVIPFLKPYSVLASPNEGTGLWMSGPSGLFWFPDGTESAQDSPAGSRAPRTVFPAARWGWDSLCATPDGRFVAASDSAGGRAAVLRGDDPDAATARMIETPGQGTGSLALSPDGKKLAVGFRYDPGLRVYDVDSATLLQSLEQPPRHQLAWSPDGRWLAAGGSVPTLRDTRDWRVAELPGISANHPPNGAAAFAPADDHGDGPLLAIVSGDTRIALYRLAPEVRLVGVLEAPEGRSVHQLCFSPDGKWLGAATADGGVQLWERVAVERITRDFGP